MKLNNRGVTLMELIVSIALISIVIMFLFRLLVDVRYSENSTDYNRSNQQKRAIILKTIQEDFLERKLVGLSDSPTPNAGELIIEFTYADHTTARLSVLPESITYTNNDGTEKWLLEKETDTTKFGIRCVSFTSSLPLNLDGEFFYIKFTIPVVVNSKKKNYIDDLEFFYLGEKKDLENFTTFPNSNNLGYYDENQCG